MDQNSAAVQKHRACDECRTRKLACTKESDGCSRCKRENIPCHYSPQKPMGRPRKRPREEAEAAAAAAAEAEATVAAPPAKTTMSELPPDTQDPGMQFINLLLGDGFQMPEPTITQTFDQHQHQHPWDYFSDVDFNTVPIPESSSATHIDPTFFTPWVDLTSPSTTTEQEQVPGLSPSSSNTAGSPERSDKPPPECTCLPKLYSALSSMQNIPTQVEAAIRQARQAAKTAYEVVNCPGCLSQTSLPPPQTTSPAQIHSFQILMMLATLIPSIVHAYEQMLTMVDQETAQAVAERRQIAFQLHGLGGVWGPLGNNGDPCGVVASFGYREMEPAMWRLTVRALLKVDVYGISGCKAAEVRDPFHLGLRDIVLLMENKSKARHAMVDAMVDAGIWQLPSCGGRGGMQAKKGDVPTCQQIIGIARSSVEGLCIA
ncbi:hypothetical protein GGS20DRAFT_498413 [Poronia punctata]|nr:hypothetical protein GGS20DRAFT_498413 [Poronia punctata]